MSEQIFEVGDYVVEMFASGLSTLIRRVVSIAPPRFPHHHIFYTIRYVLKPSITTGGRGAPQDWLRRAPASLLIPYANGLCGKERDEAIRQAAVNRLNGENGYEASRTYLYQFSVNSFNDGSSAIRGMGDRR